MEINSQSEKLLVIFQLDDKSYGLGVEDVSSIIRMQAITYVPHTPDYVRGLINLRGVIVPVIDLRLRLGLKPASDSKATRIIILEFDGLEVGVTVDSVSHTALVNTSDIQLLSFTGNLSSQYLLGETMDGTNSIKIISVQKVLTRENN